MAVKDAMQLVSEARLAYQAKRYTAAVEHFRNALSVLPQGQATEKLRKFINESLSDALIARAIDYRSVGRNEEAIEFLREAIQLAPDNQRAKVELSHTQDPVRTNPALSPKHVGDVEEVSRLLTLGYSYIDLGKYDEAIKTFKAVAQYDEYNQAAQRGIEQAHRQRSAYFRAAYDERRAEMLTEVDKTWDDTLKHEVEPGPAISGSSQGVVADGSGEEEKQHADALANMRVESLSFDGNTIEDVLEVLRNHIKRYESEGARSSRPIAVLSNFGSPDTPEYQQLMQKRISLTLEDVTVKDLIDEISRFFDLECYYLPMGIEFSYSGKDYGRLMERTFNVPPHFFESGSSDDDDDDSEGGGFGSSSGMSVNRVNPVKVLEDRGVSFPEGANASYRPSSRRLVVRNTMQNLAKIEELLNTPPPDAKVIVLNIIAVETKQKNLEELGFDWLFNAGLNGELFAGGGQRQSSSGILGLPLTTQTGAGRQGEAVTGGLRHIRQVLGSEGLDRLIQEGSLANYENNAFQPTPSIFGVRGVWTAADVTLMMRGLSQKSGVDFLYNPRFVFDPNSEEPVTIVNVRELIYPENYDAPQVPQERQNNYDDWNQRNRRNRDREDRNTGTNSGVPVVAGAHPTDFKRYGYTEEDLGGVGTIVQIHKAELSGDGQTVNLSLIATVNDFEGFVDWGSPIYSAMWSPSTNEEEVSIKRLTLTENHIYQPIFKRRLVTSTIAVANGGVIVMGGLQEARIVRFEDKVPVLGDLPFVGRFFRTEGESNDRRALLIFAKVDIVDPTGRNVRSGETDTATQSPI